MKQDEFRKLNGKDKQFVLALDCGVKTGVAAYDRSGQEWAKILTKDFHFAYDLATKINPSHWQIIIENPDSQRKIYKRLDSETGERKREKIASNVGSNRREATLLIERFESLGFQVLKVTPKGRKWSAQDLAMKTGITQRTSEHARDAIRLIYDNGF